MNHQTKRHLIIATLTIASASFARADNMYYTYDLTGSASLTLQALGRDFIIGCVALAAGLVVAAFIFKKKQ
jgi:hypothetical protein